MRSKKSQITKSLKLPFKQKSLIRILIVMAISATMLAMLAFKLPVSAQTDESLASQYAPVLHFTAAEKFYPTTVDYAISNSVLKQRCSSGEATVVGTSLSPENLGTFTQADLFLDNNAGTRDAIASDYSSKASGLGYYAYVHMVQSGGSTVIQYWLFYDFNDGPLNQHQGDWEVIQVLLNNAASPQTLLLSQHGAGENAAWADVEKENGHPVAYVAQGSHANYFRAYQGKIGIENDIVGNDGKTIQPSDLNLVVLGEQGNHPTDQSWLDFSGRWGYWGTDQEVALGKAGPYGPIFNQDGVRWAQPQNYLDQTFSVSGMYFILAWVVSSFLLIFLIYIVARGAYKSYGIYKLNKKGGLRLGKVLKGISGIGFAIGIVAVVITVVALFLPWYNITASSQSGPLAQNGNAPLMTLDGVSGMKVNLFMGTSNSDSSSGFVGLFSAQMPFAIIFAAGIVLLVLDIVGMKSGRSFAKKLWIGVVAAVLPIIFILLFISQLPAFLPFANGLFPGQSIPAGVTDLIQAVARSPMAGTATQTFDVVGATTVTWGIGIGVYLLIIAAVLRIVGGALMYVAPEPTPTPAASSVTGAVPPPPPPSSQVAGKSCPYCQHPVASEVQFCTNCGKRLT